jgi:hypothetical protein
MKLTLISFVLVIVIVIFLIKKMKKSDETFIDNYVSPVKTTHIKRDSSEKYKSFSKSTATNIFATKVRGVSHKNPDGTDRQKIIKKCEEGEILDLVREPDNPYNIANIAVFRKSGEQIGNLSKDVAFRHPSFKDLAYYMDNGAEVSAKIIGITGGGRKSYGCNIEISVGTIPWEEKEKEAKALISESKNLEKNDPNKSIDLYIKAINLLLTVDKLAQETLFYKRTGVQLDYISPNAVLRSTRFPINRLTLLLEKNNRNEKCLEVLENYDKIADPLGISKGDMESIRKRKDRVIKNLS